MELELVMQLKMDWILEFVQYIVKILIKLGLMVIQDNSILKEDINNLKFFNFTIKYQFFILKLIFT